MFTCLFLADSKAQTGKSKGACLKFCRGVRAAAVGTTGKMEGKEKQQKLDMWRVKTQ